MNYRVLLILSSLLLANKAQAPAPVLSKQEALEQEHQRNQMLNEQEANKAKAYAKKIGVVDNRELLSSQHAH